MVTRKTIGGPKPFKICSDVAMFRNIEWEPVWIVSRRKVDVNQSLWWPAPDGTPICAKTSDDFDLELEESTQELLDACSDVEKAIEKIPKTRTFIGISPSNEMRVASIDNRNVEQISKCEFFLQWTTKSLPVSRFSTWYDCFGKAIPLPEGNTGKFDFEKGKLTIVAKAHSAEEVEVMGTFIFVNSVEIERVAVKKTS